MTTVDFITELFCRVDDRHLVDAFMADPSLLGVIDSYGIELLHPRREGHHQAQIGKKDLSDQCWIVRDKLCFVLNYSGCIVDWQRDTANVYDGTAFQRLVDKYQDDMILFADMGFRKTD